MFRRHKSEGSFIKGLRQVRLCPRPKPMDKRTTEGRKLDPRGYRRVTVYMTPAEFQVLDTISREEGASHSQLFRACLRACFDLQDVKD